MHISRKLYVKNGIDDINIGALYRGFYYYMKPAELRQFNNAACLVIHSIENNPLGCRNNYCNVSVTVLSLDSAQY